MQGIGVSTPNAAAVAAATVGFAGEEHIPKVMGSLGISMIVAIKKFCAIAVVCDVTVSGLGATPNVHWHNAFITAAFPLVDTPFVIRRH